jgi:hypothetical protein
MQDLFCSLLQTMFAEEGTIRERRGDPPSALSQKIIFKFLLLHSFMLSSCYSSSLDRHIAKHQTIAPSLRSFIHKFSSSSLLFFAIIISLLRKGGSASIQQKVSAAASSSANNFA